MNNQQQFPYQPQSDDNQGNDNASSQHREDNTQYPFQYMNNQQQPQNDQNPQDTGNSQPQQATSGAQNFDNFWQNNQSETTLNQPQNDQQPEPDTHSQELQETVPHQEEDSQQRPIPEEQIVQVHPEPAPQTQPHPNLSPQQPPADTPQQFAQNDQTPQQPNTVQQQPQTNEPQQFAQNYQEPMTQEQGYVQEEQSINSEPQPQQPPGMPAQQPQPQQPEIPSQQPPADTQQQESQQSEEDLLHALKSNQPQGPPQIQNFKRRGNTQPVEETQQQADQPQEGFDEQDFSAPTGMHNENEDMNAPEYAYQQPAETVYQENIPTNQEATGSVPMANEQESSYTQNQTENPSHPQNEVQGLQNPQPNYEPQQISEPARQPQPPLQQQEEQIAENQLPAREENIPNQTPQSSSEPQPPYQSQPQPEPMTDTPVYGQQEQVQQAPQNEVPAANNSQQPAYGESFANYGHEPQAVNGQTQAPPQPDEVSTTPVQGTPQAANTFNLPQQQVNPSGNSSSQVTHMNQPVAATETQQQVNSFKTKAQNAASKAKKINYKPLLMAAAFSILFYTTVFHSQVILGQVQYFTTPSGSAETPVGATDIETPVGDENRILIPQIDVNVPVVYDEPSFKEEKVQKALERGVVHYGNTAMPGEKGNSVIVGHSSNNWWNSGKYKFAFILLDKLNKGDEIVLHYQGTRYVYEVTKKEVVVPTDTSVLDQSGDPRITLITCTPPGTSWKRLIVEAKQVSPDPSENVEADSSAQEATKLPDDSGSGGFFESIGEWF